ncbi:hypothetical protein Gotur_013110, partial [Gossypium turneri]
TRAIRNARAEYSVEPAKRITASIVGSEEVIQCISIVSESQKRLPTEDKSGAGIIIHDNNEGEESAAMRFEGEVSLGDLIWLKLLGKTCLLLWLFDLATTALLKVCSLAAFVTKASLKVMTFNGVCDKSAAKGHDL